MTRLWDKGDPLDDRVLRYTAGEDHLLDARLVPYDVRGSIAHAEMLHGAGLLSAADLDARRARAERHIQIARRRRLGTAYGQNGRRRHGYLCRARR